ncbi:MAG TPA: hypothetical protein ACFE0H_14840 [Elainellaceae cyanobacterium]
MSQNEPQPADEQQNQSQTPPDTQASENAERGKKEPVDPRDLVYKEGTLENAREVIENPAVTPEMLNEPQEGRGFRK